MKKRFVKALILLTISVALTGCSDKKEAENATSESVTETESIAEETPESSSADLAATGKAEDTKDMAKVEVEQTVTEEIESTQEAPSSEQPTAPEPEYTVEGMDKTMYAQNAVNLRVGPSTSYEKGGSLKKGQQVHVTGKASTGWYQLEDGLFVSNNYLGDKKPEVIVASNQTGTGTGNKNNGVQDANIVLAEDGVWIDGVFYPYNPEKGTTTPTPSKPEEEPTEKVTTYEVTLLPELLTLVNNKRAENGVSAYVWNTAREEDAKARAQELVEKFAHRSPGGYGSATECITMYGPDVNEIFDAYSRSEMHNSALNIETKGYYFVSANCTEYVNGKVNRNFNVVMIDRP